MPSPADALNDLTRSFSSMKAIGRSKGLAKIGDAITNLIYSSAKSIVMKNLDVRNVNRTILSTALKQAELKPYAPLRSNAHDLADAAEAFIGYVYCAQLLSFDKMVEVLLEYLQRKDLNNHHIEQQAAIEAFTALLKKIKDQLHPQFS